MTTHAPYPLGEVDALAWINHGGLKEFCAAADLVARLIAQGSPNALRIREILQARGRVLIARSPRSTPRVIEALMVAQGAQRAQEHPQAVPRTLTWRDRPPHLRKAADILKWHKENGVPTPRYGVDCGVDVGTIPMPPGVKTRRRAFGGG